MATIKVRNQKLSSILKKNELSEEDKEYIKECYINHYTLIDDYNKKLTREDILDVGSETIMREGFYSKCFYIEGINYKKKKVHFNISKKYLSGVKHSRKEKIHKILRLAIQEQINDWIKENPRPLDVDQPEADHIYPFSRIVEDYLEKRKLSYDTIKIKEDTINVKNKFMEYHKEVARYQWLSKKINGKKSNSI